MISFWKYASIYPPCLCRLMARTGRKGAAQPMGLLEIAQAAHMSPAMVESISQSTSWNDINVFSMHRFLLATKMDFCDWRDMRLATAYLRSKPNFEHLRKSPEWKTYWLPLMIRWRKSCGTADLNTWRPLRELLTRLDPLLK